MPDSTLLRSLLFVPGDNESKLRKAAGVPADALVIDWEDAVLPEQKPHARERTLHALSERSAYPQTVLVRLNAVETDEFEADCQALANCVPDGLMIPKCSSPDHADKIAAFLERTDPEGRCSIYALIESAAGVVRAPEIANCSPRVAALAFGAEDFSAQMGIHRSENDIELLYARSAVVTAARAGAREAYESPCLDFRNLDRVRDGAHRARNLGFSGQLAIHPGQVPILNEVFSPTEGEIAEAQRILDTFAKQGTGVMAVEGKVVDEPVLRRARRILQLAEVCWRSAGN